jgi:hypothetical protein
MAAGGGSLVVGGHGGALAVHRVLEVTRRASEGRAVPL